MIISVKSTVWEDYHIDDDKYDDVINGLASGDILIHDLYEHSYVTEINHDSIEMINDSNGNPIVEDENGINPITGGACWDQPDPTLTDRGKAMGGKISKPKEDEDEGLLL